MGVGTIASKQKGVALIIVLMIVALVTVLATEMAGRLQLQVKRASNIKDNNQAYWYAMGAEQFARKSIGDLIELDSDIVNRATMVTKVYLSVGRRRDPSAIV